MLVCTFDGSIPKGAIQSIISATTNVASVSVSSGGLSFSNGDVVYVVSSTGVFQGGAVVTGTPTDTSIPLNGALSVPSGGTIAKADANMVNYCKNNVAPNYEGYQLHYKLANPEPITDDNCHIHGDIPLLDVGDNYLYIDSGIVLGEIPIMSTDGASQFINSSQNVLRNKAGVINNIYKNNIFDTSKWIIVPYVSSSVISCYADIPNASFDSSVTYTVDYKILATQAPQIGSIRCSYSQDIVTAINKLSEEMNNKQEHDSILDTIVDLSLYEKNTRQVATLNKFLPVLYVGASAYADFEFVFSGQKKCVPTISISNISLYLGASLSNGFSISAVYTTTKGCIVRFITTDSTAISNLKSYGVQGWVDIVADCRGRI